MKKLVLILTLALIFSCSDKQEVIANEEFLEIEVPDYFLSKSTSNKSSNVKEIFEVETVEIQITNKDGSITTGKIRFTMPENHGEYLQKVEMTSNIFEETNLTADFFVNKNNLEQSKVYQKGSCIASCHSTYTDKEGKKIKGRGWCKAGCRADAIIKVAGLIVAIVKLT